jgi:hypothetical protein
VGSVDYHFLLLTTKQNQSNKNPYGNKFKYISTYNTLLTNELETVFYVLLLQKTQ